MTMDLVKIGAILGVKNGLTTAGTYQITKKGGNMRLLDRKSVV